MLFFRDRGAQHQRLTSAVVGTVVAAAVGAVDGSGAAVAIPKTVKDCGLVRGKEHKAKPIVALTQKLF